MSLYSETYKAMDIAEKLRAKGTPFAIATVVRTVASTAAKPGMKALVLPNGDFADGWLGGGCVTAAVKKAAIRAIKTGESTLVCLRPEELLADMTEASQDDTVQIARNGCPSKGSMDIFIEPVTPQPELLVFGSGPVAAALLRIASSFSFTLVLCGDIEIGSAERRFTSPEEVIGALLPNIDRYAVVATQGKGDIASLTAAISMVPIYTAFVGSRRKFSSYRDKLIEAGVTKQAIDKVRSPAGLHINAVTPDEIALSIMAEIIQTRRTISQLREASDAS